MRPLLAVLARRIARVLAAVDDLDSTRPTI